MRRVLLCTTFIAINLQLFSQSSTNPSIEVASVKPSKSGNSIGNHFDPERMTWSNVPLRVLIQSAYGLQAYQIVGGPSWLDSDRWNIDAKTNSPTTTAEKLYLLQPLLGERFELRFHRTTKEMTELALVIAKNGPKLHQVDDNATSKTSTRISRGLIEGHRLPIGQLVGFLKSELGRPVLDSTGLKGKYDFRLEWTPDESQPNSGGIAATEDLEGASIFSAIRDQLGLTLKPIKGPVDIFVIDHVQKAIVN